jgi:hypothetical protein
MKTALRIAFLFLAFASLATAQDERKFTFTGAARGQYFGDNLKLEGETDTITPPKVNSGHVLVDLGLNIRPNRNTEILGMVRVRNDYGGFWGSGVTFDVRQLYVRGVIGGIIKYQLGDFNYRMSRYTMWNYDQEVVSNLPAILQQQTDVVNYEYFFNTDHSRRQQGAALDFALVFKKFVKELSVNAVTTRNRITDLAQNDDRLFSGLNLNLVQSNYLELGYNYANLYDVSGTSKASRAFRNPVHTATAKIQYQHKNWGIVLESEAGKSETLLKNDSLAPAWNGKFGDALLRIEHKKTGLGISLNSIYVSSAFRSPGAQTKRIAYGQGPLAYNRISNSQDLRSLTMFDLMRETNLYTLQIRPYLMEFAPQYDNITPYGDATPNRQGLIAGFSYAKGKLPLDAGYKFYMLQEVRGEGTLQPRKFIRHQVNAQLRIHEFFKKLNRSIQATFNYRNDVSSRPAEELVRGINLKTRSMSAGIEMEILPAFDLMAGYQVIRYAGADFTAIRNEYSEIINFREFNTDGMEQIIAYGARYRFSEKTFVSAQVNSFRAENKTDAIADYRINQFMLLFQLKF